MINSEALLVIERDLKVSYIYQTPGLIIPTLPPGDTYHPFRNAPKGVVSYSSATSKCMYRPIWNNPKYRTY